jgi:uncharacterized protein (DUF3084 family)
MIFGFQLSDLLTVYSLAGTSIAGIFLWIFKDRLFQKNELKKADLENKKEELDYAKEIREYFLIREGDLKDEKEDLKTQLKLNSEETKSEREYYRSKVTEIRKLCEDLQGKFDNMTLAYAKETEASQTWMRKFFEIEKENKTLKLEIIDLSEKYIKLEKDHESLKKQFENYKKANK